jgi:hypothetical protein
VVLAARQIVAARLAVGDTGAGEALELNRDVLQHVAEPGPLVLGHAAHEAAGRIVRAGVLAEARHQREQPLVEAGQTQRRVLLQLAEVDPQADHRPQGVEVRPAVDAGLQDLHRYAPWLGITRGS